MFKKFVVTGVWVLCALGLSLPFMKAKAASSFEKQPDGLILDLPAGKLKVQVLTDSIIHVVYAVGNSFPQRQSLVVPDKSRPAAEWQLTESPDTFLIQTGKIQAKISRSTGAITFLDRAGKIILQEADGGGRTMTKGKVQGEETYHAGQAFLSTPDEGLYGLGQYQDGVMNWRGHEVLMAQANTIAVVPFLLSTRGYGILWDNCSLSKFKSGGNEFSLESEVADGVLYYFIYGPEPDRVIAGYRELTGPAPMFGKWAFGYFQSKERYKTGEELVATVKQYRERKLPLDVIVQDWMYWGKLGWSAMQFDPSVFPNPKAMIAELHNKYQVHLMISVWPKFGPETDIFRAMKEKGFLYSRPGTGGTGVYDAFHPEARKLYWDYLNQGLFAQGVDAWWLDGTEPEFSLANLRSMETRDFKKAGPTALGSTARYLNAYSLMTTEGVYRGQRGVTENQRVFILTRSAFAGQQRNAAATWSGDIKASWEVFSKQIPAGLNISMAGIPYWTTDIGGFFVSYEGGRKNHGREELEVQGYGRFEVPTAGSCKNDAYRELYVRWFQYGAFCPIFRSHGTMTPREIWQFGEKGTWAYDTLERYDNLRYRLMPYIYSLGWKVTSEGYTIMRGLPMDFRADENARDISDQFMFGPAILVNPVTEAMYHKEVLNTGAKILRFFLIPATAVIVTETKVQSRKVYLPEAPAWFDFWTGKKIAGGQTVDAPAPIETMPLFVKAGSIIPLGPFLQYALEKPADPIEIRVYPGADADFTLYEDDGLTYNYEKGEYATINLHWDDAAQTLSIGERKGIFPGMLGQRTFQITRVRENAGTGLAPTERPDRTIIFTGKALQVGL